MGFRPAHLAGLTATLYEYQRRALAWLLQREGAALPHSRSATDAGVAADASGSHPCWRAVRLPAGSTVFVSLLTGEFVSACWARRQSIHSRADMAFCRLLHICSVLAWWASVALARCDAMMRMPADACM